MSETVEGMLTEIRQLMSGHTNRREEARIIQILDEANADERNDLLQQLNLAHLISDVDDRWFGPDNRTRLLELLTKERLSELEVESRVAIVNALQEGRTDRLREEAIRNVFVGTEGADLIKLKNEIDAGGDYRDLQQLVYTDIDDNGIREEILGHIQAQGQALGQLPAVKVLSDIDDTLFPSLKDDRYPKLKAYPGVTTYYRELMKGSDAQERGQLVFLTARPKVRTGLIERYTQRSLRRRGVPEATILSGDFLHLIGNQQIAEKKQENFLQYRKLFPEYGFVFTGDSGQGDAIFGEKIRAEVRAVFIHDVVDTPREKRAEWRAKGVAFFDTYIGAAAEAFEARLISSEGLGNVLENAQAEFSRTTFKHPDRSQADEDRARSLIGS